jgi:HSP20 family protein
MAISNSRMLARRDPFRGRTRGLDRFFSDPFFRTPLRGFWSNGRAQPAHTSTVLPVDIADSDSELTVTASVPGYDREDISVQVDDGILTIAAQHTAETTADDGETDEVEVDAPKYVRRERRYGAVRRSFTLPTDLRDSELKADLRNGVLTVHIPRVEAPAPTVIDVEVVAE